MDISTDEQIAARILQKLHRRGNWGASHTSFENVKKGFTQRDVGKRGAKRVDKIAMDLIKKGLVVSKPTGYGLEVSLNPGMRENILKYVEWHSASRTPPCHASSPRTAVSAASQRSAWSRTSRWVVFPARGVSRPGRRARTTIHTLEIETCPDVPPELVSQYAKRHEKCGTIKV